MKSEMVVSDIRHKRKGHLNPVVVNFENGNVMDRKQDLKAKLLPHDEPSGKMIEISAPDGQIFVNKPIPVSPMGDRFIAIRNRKTNKIKLVEVDYSMLINSVYVKEVEKEEAAVSENLTEATGKLKTVFGTKRAIRHWAQKRTLNIDESYADDQISEMLAAPAANESIKENDEDSNPCSLAPPCDRNAEDLSSVYKIEDCMTEQEINSLMDTVTDIIDEKLDLSSCSDFLKENLKEAMKNKQNIKLRIACLLYADALARYLKIPAKAIGKSIPQICPYSKLIGRKIVNEFSVKFGSNINRPLSMKDKGVCHVIVLTLIACNYSVNLEALSKHLTCGFPKMKQLGKIIGIVQSAKASSNFVLKLPLPPLPKMVKSTRRK